MQRGKIIYLNGVSSSGKTTLAKALQGRLDEPYYWFSVDTFVNMTPEKFIDNDLWLNAISGMYRSIKTFSDMGLNVIVDDVFDDSQELLDEVVEILHGHPVLFVHVTCPLDELVRREKERGDREIGLSENQLPQLCPLCQTYDITVDTHNNTIEECADRIIEMLVNDENSTAFNKLYKNRTQEEA
ncbi:MAG: chloramphenicol phosphotransferase CPT family protein [Defluviitaleaceae bacterium]|nr:chloramphenicol phosphotransferase CPT family protein [Defluviitaleaceae bacterium]